MGLKAKNDHCFLLLTRISHQVLSRGGANGHGCKARDGRIPQATCSEAAGLDQYVEESDRARPIHVEHELGPQQTCPDAPPQQKSGEKCGLSFHENRSVSFSLESHFTVSNDECMCTE